MTDTLLRVAVISDLHAYEGSKPDIGHPTLKINSESEGDLINPIAALKALIARERLSVDLVISPGDLANQANPHGIEYAWTALQSVATAMGTTLCVAASGNHDVDSRGAYQKFDPLEKLKGLQPSYPVDDQFECFRYWSQHFAIIDREEFRTVVLNSSAFHWREAEWERGRISLATIDWLEKELRRRGRRDLNLLVCHHHPHRHPELRMPNSSFDVMVDGNHLIESLSKGDSGDWLIVHGHKHHPMISYAAGSAQSPVIFSAGSFSGPIYDELGSVTRNQFYIIEIPLTELRQIGLVGWIRAWTWSYGKGWKKATDGDGMPSQSAFGNRTAPALAANQIANWLGSDTSFKTWGELVAIHPELRFLLPSDYEQLRARLRDNFKILIEEEAGLPVQLGRVK